MDYIDLQDSNLSVMAESIMKTSQNRNEMLENIFIKNSLITIEKHFNNFTISTKMEISTLNNSIRPRMDVIDCIMKEFSNHLKIQSSTRSKLLYVIQDA